MKTEVVMFRKFGEGEIRQKSKSTFLCATDLVKIANEFRRKNGLSDFNERVWFQNKSTKEFIEELEVQTGSPVIIKGRGRNSATWVHPFLFLDLALALNPKFKIEVYEWLYDCLLKYRNNSGDSYKKMCGALYLTQSNKNEYQKEIISLASRIQKECGLGVSENAWNNATETQLKLRDKIHEYIAQFSDVIKDRETLYRVSIEKAKKEINS